MNGKRLLLIILFMSTLFPMLKAQKGPAIENFTLTDVLTNENISLTDFSGKKAVAVIFTDTYCPFAKVYDERIKQMASEFSSKGVQFILINPSEKAQEIAAKVKSKGFNLPYLSDSEQAVTKMLKASKNPEAFLLVPKDNKFQLVYQGAIDDNPQYPDDVSEAFLSEAIERVINGQQSYEIQRPTGCMIRKI